MIMYALCTHLAHKYIYHEDLYKPSVLEQFEGYIFNVMYNHTSERQKRKQSYPVSATRSAPP